MPGGYDLDTDGDGIPVSLARRITAEARAAARAPITAHLERVRLARARRRHALSVEAAHGIAVARAAMCATHARAIARTLRECALCHVVRRRRDVHRVQVGSRGFWACRGPCAGEVTL